MQERACVLTDAGPCDCDTQRSTPVLAEVGRDRSKTWVEASNEELSSGCQKRSAGEVTYTVPMPTPTRMPCARMYS